MPTPSQFDIKSSIGQAIDEAKAVMREKMADLFTPLTDAWENMKKGPLSEIGPAFAKMWAQVQETWDSFWSGFSTGWDNMSGVFETFLMEVKPALAEAWRALGDLWNTVADALGLANIEWSGFAARLGEWIGSNAAQFIMDFLDATVKGIEDFFKALGTLQGWIESVRTSIEGWQTAIDTMKQSLEFYKDKADEAGISSGIIGMAFEVWKERVEGLKTVLSTFALPDWLRPGSPTIFEIALRGIVDAFNEVTKAATQFSVFQELRATLEELVTVFIPLFVSEIVRYFIVLRDETIRLMRELTETVIQLFRRMRDLVVRAVREMIARVLAALEEFYEILKEDTLVKIAEIFEEMAGRIAEAIAKINEEIDRLNCALDDLIDKANKARDALEGAGLIGKSPSKLELDLRGAVQAMRRLSAVEMPRLSASVARIGGPVPAYAPAAAGGMASTSVTVPIGPVYISGRTDIREFELRVEDAVRRAIGTRW
jgi:methyl-accepting chemotaxis protein